MELVGIDTQHAYERIRDQITTLKLQPGAPLNEAELQHLEQYASVMQCENYIPLGIAGLLEPNMRVQAFALRTLKERLDLPAFDIDMAAASAQQDVQNAAAIALAHVRAMPEWAPYLA